MNQTLKEVIYSKGSPRQLKYIMEQGGMNEEERQLFLMLHEGKSDLYIQEEMGLDRKSFCRVEESVRAKVTIAAFHCIDTAMDVDENRIL